MIWNTAMILKADNS